MIINPSYSELRTIIRNEYLNGTGFVPPAASDADIRSAGTAAVVEGLYDHQNHIAKQLFVLTADEPFLYVHADEIGVPRLGGSIASGQVKAYGTTDGVSLPVGSRLTDGFGRYWLTLATATLSATSAVIVPVQATTSGAAHNQTGTLTWVSPVSGLQGVAEIVVLSGGSDGEDLERWRSRIWQRKKLGKSLSRAEDLRQAVLGVAGVADAFVYPLRRGAGSVDVAVTAQGANGATLPSDQLLNDAEAALRDAAVFFESVKTFKPQIVSLDVSAALTGAGINFGEASRIITDYLNALAPAEPYRESVLSALLLALEGVTDVQLTPNNNVEPQVSIEQVGWIRAGNISVTL